MEEKKTGGMNLNAKAFLISLLVIFALMVAAYVLTFVIPGGAYARIENADGDTVIDTDSAFAYVEGGLPFWKWLLSPVLVLGADGGGTLLAVIAFLLVIGGAFNALTVCGVMKYMLERLTHAFGKTRYRLMAILCFFFMAMGSLIGSFEECVPLVPIVVALSMALGWDAITGLGMSILAAGCGFAAGVCNPFTVGVAQKLSGLPMFSGVWMRLLSFALIYGLLLLFIRAHAKRVERPVEQTEETFVRDAKMDKAILTFGVILGVGILTVFLSGLVPALQDYSMIIVAVMFLVGGISATLVSGMSGKNTAVHFGKGALGILPAVLMILMASSIKYILEEAHILDTILHAAIDTASGMPRFFVILFVYALVLLMNFFIASGSAKAFMMIPLLLPLSGAIGIPMQLCVLAYAFGDGFSNVFYPTNPVLLLSLNLGGVGYGDWVKWNWKFQLSNLVLTSLLLLFALAVGYC